MSPLLFLLIVEGLSKMLHKAKIDGGIESMKIGRILRITHLLFVDYVVLFGRGTLEEWSTYNVILDIFNNAIGMAINESKSIFLECDLDVGLKDQIETLFPFHFQQLDCSFK